MGYRKLLDTLGLAVVLYSSLGSLQARENSYSITQQTPEFSYSKEGTKHASRSVKKPAKPRKPSSPLKGSHSALIEQNKTADKYNLSRIENMDELRRFERGGILVRLPERTGHYYLSDNFPNGMNYARPYTKLFLDRFSSQYFPKCGEPLKVTEAVRTKEYQRYLDRTNPNAAPAAGPTASSHLTGATIDISTKDMCHAGLVWARKELASLDRKGYIEATQERVQPTFHIMVYPNYPEYVQSLQKPSKKAAKQ